MKTVMIFLACLFYIMFGIAIAAFMIKNEEDFAIDTDENVGCGIIILALCFGIFWLPISIVYCVYCLIKLLCK